MRVKHSVNMPSHKKGDNMWDLLVNICVGTVFMAEKKQL